MVSSRTEAGSGALQHHPKPVIALHWLTAFLLLAVFALVLLHEAFDSRALRAALLQGHRGLGLLVWLLAAARLVVRGRVGLHAPSPASPRASRLASLAVQALMYALLLGLPLLGWLLTNARGQPVVLPTGWALPSLMARDLDWADTLESVHAAAAWALSALVGLHMVAALWHHHVRRDRVLVAMLPGLRPRA